MEEQKKDENNEIQTEIDYTRKKLHVWFGIAAVFLLLSLALAVGIFVIINNLDKISVLSTGKILEPDNNASTEIVNENDGKVRRSIDGVYVEEGRENYYPTAVIIDNHPDARPPSSLSKANLVYEVEAEGGATRFLAIFADGEKTPQIGPVRSARPYFIDWSKEVSALFIHVGGSPAALAKISKEKIFNLNEFYQGLYFWRSNKKYAPHNVYTSSEYIDKYLKDKKKDTEVAEFTPWLFKDDAKIENRGYIDSVKIGFLLQGFNVEWKYETEENSFARYMGDLKHKDLEGGEIKAKNVIVQYVPAREIDDKLRLEMSYIGEGKALVCLDGSCHESTWKKASGTARTRFYLNEEEIVLNAGTTWIEVVRPSYKVSY